MTKNELKIKQEKEAMQIKEYESALIYCFSSVLTASRNERKIIDLEELAAVAEEYKTFLEGSKQRRIGWITEYTLYLEENPED